MKTITTQTVSGKYMVSQLMDDKIDFEVTNTNPRNKPDFTTPDNQENKIIVVVRPGCNCDPACKTCEIAVTRALNNAAYWLGEATARVAPYNSTDDY